MHLKCALICLLVAHLYLLLPLPVASQFWRHNAPSERELFELETRSAMESGICYKEVAGRTANPDLRMRIISYCCEGYQRAADMRTMKCQPICAEDCSNGICTAPEICECYPGYERRGGRCEEM